MLPAQRALLRLQAAAKKRLGPRQVALGVEHAGQVVDAGERVGVLPAQRALAGLQAATQKRLGPGIVAFGIAHAGQVVDAAQRGRGAPGRACAPRPPRARW